MKLAEGDVRMSNCRFCYAIGVLLTVVAFFLLVDLARAEGRQEGKPALAPIPSSMELSILKKRLQIVHTDIEAFRAFAKDFWKSGDKRSLANLQKPVDEFLSRFDYLVTAALERKNLETVQMAAEITFCKARLFQHLGRIDAARKTADELGESGAFASYQSITVVPPCDFGKCATTTLGDGYLALKGDLDKSADTEKDMKAGK